MKILRALFFFENLLTLNPLFFCSFNTNWESSHELNSRERRVQAAALAESIPGMKAVLKPVPPHYEVVGIKRGGGGDYLGGGGHHHGRGSRERYSSGGSRYNSGGGGGGVGGGGGGGGGGARSGGGGSWGSRGGWKAHPSLPPRPI